MKMKRVLWVVLLASFLAFPASLLGQNLVLNPDIIFNPDLVKPGLDPGLFIPGDFDFVLDDDWEQVRIAYAPSAGGWWSGLCITNTSTVDISPYIYIYNDDGDQACSKSVGTLEPNEMYVTTVSALDTCMTGFTNTVSMLVSSAADNGTFETTIFVGNEGMGFAFQQQSSHTVAYVAD